MHSSICIPKDGTPRLVDRSFADRNTLTRQEVDADALM
jgi:hypothetical protein